MSKRLSFEESFQRAFKAAVKNGPLDVSAKRSRAFRDQSAKDASARRFIGDCQIDLKFRRLGTDPNGSVRPWYIIHISVGKMRHKFGLGGGPDWQKHDSPMADEIVDELARSAVRFALDEEDDSIPDHVTATVKAATDKALKEGVYEVRKTI